MHSRVLSETNSDYFHYTALNGFCTRGGMCLLRGTDWVFVFCVDLRTNSNYFPIKH
jgi:hypothetical protein